MKHAAALLLALFLIAPAWASPWTLGAHVASAHSDMDPWTRNDNPGLYIRHASGVQVGAYRNSLGRNTVYGALSYAVGPIDVSAGVASGYQRQWQTWDTADGRRFAQFVGSSNAALTPFATLSTAFNVPGLPVAPRLTWMPKIGAIPQHVLHLSIEARF
jgi:hypothetical protein